MSWVSDASQDLRALGREESLEADRFLWREGDRGDEVVLLLDGTLDVVHEPAAGEPVVPRSLEPGAIVGEIAALELFWQKVDRVRSLTGQVTQTYRAAITDSLAGLYNFGIFRDRLGLEVDRARATGDPLSLAVFDIDLFKGFNDRHGHAAGNDVLVRVAGATRSTSRRGDVLARYGGEELVALLYGAHRAEAAAFADQIRVHVSDLPLGERGLPERVAVSGGVATLPDGAESAAGFFEAADANLYRAKESGRNRVVAEAR